jgi:hypothetical protein
MENSNTLVYGESRFMPVYSPKTIYIPNIEIMFKMMHACIGVKKPKDLWICKQ